MLAGTLEDFGFNSMVADLDIWRRRAKWTDGTEYYELLLFYVDDILLVSHDPRPSLIELGKVFALKEGSLGTPDIYLGAQIYQHSLPDGRKSWGMSSERYVTSLIETVEGLLKEDGDGYHLKSTAKEPVPLSSKPELDVSPELGPKLASQYRQMVEILRW